MIYVLTMKWEKEIENCGACPLSGYLTESWMGSDVEVFHCLPLYKEIKDKRNGRLKDCPLIELGEGEE